MSVLSETINEALHPEARPKPNLELLRQVLRQIDDEPNLWIQDRWRDVDNWCGTAYCVAGWAVALTGGQWEDDGDDDGYLIAVPEDESPLPYVTVAMRARRLLGLTQVETAALFRGDNTREEVEAIAGRIRLRAFEEFGEDPLEEAEYDLPPVVVSLAVSE